MKSSQAHQVTLLRFLCAGGSRVGFCQTLQSLNGTVIVDIGLAKFDSWFFVT